MAPGSENTASETAPSNRIIEGDAAHWPKVFGVNVFGAMHIVKVFVPHMIKDGPLQSGRKSFIVTTSSVVGLVNHVPGPYSVRS